MKGKGISVEGFQRLARVAELIGNTRSAETYEEMVANYKWFTVNRVTGEVNSGWEYREDARDATNEMNEGSEGKEWVVRSRRTLSPEQLMAFENSSGL